MKKLKDLKKGDKFYIILGKEHADIPKLIEGEGNNELKNKYNKLSN